MFFRQVLHEDLGCASYVVADDGDAAVIDPKWDVEAYLELADEHGFRIAHVLETHNHADHVSGKGRLAKLTGATIHVPATAEVEFEHEPLADGDTISVGEVTITALATPGHRPEHTAYLVSDRSRGEEPWLVVTGDSLFVGDVARPDLAVDPEEGARGLFESLKRLLALHDFAEVWPGHIGGSLCGGAGMSEKPMTTIGFERRFNRLLARDDEDGFVRALTGNLAHQPPNFKRIVALNRGPLLTEPQTLEPLAPAALQARLEAGATLLDGRDTREFDAVHVPGSINVTMVRAAVGTRAAWVVDAESEVVVAAASDDEADRMGRLLEAVGFRRISGLPGRRRRRLARRRAPGRVHAGDRHRGARRAAQARRRPPPRRSRRGRVGRGPRRRLAPRALPRPARRAAGGAPERRQAARGRLLGGEPELDRGFAPPARRYRGPHPRRRRRHRGASGGRNRARPRKALVPRRHAGACYTRPRRAA